MATARPALSLLSTSDPTSLSPGRRAARRKQKALSADSPQHSAVCCCLLCEQRGTGELAMRSVGGDYGQFLALVGSPHPLAGSLSAPTKDHSTASQDAQHNARLDRCTPPPLDEEPAPTTAPQAGNIRPSVRATRPPVPVVSDHTITLPFPLPLDDLGRYLVRSAVQRTGSLNAAARLLGRSYAWTRALCFLKKRRCRKAQ